MSDSGTNRWRFTVAFWPVVCLLVTLVLVQGIVTHPTAAQSSSAVSISQSPSSVSIEAGSTHRFTAILAVPEEYNAPAIDVDLPQYWDVVSQSSSGRYRESEQQWLWYEGGEKTVEYTIHVPSNATTGTYQVDVEGSAVNPDTDEIESARTNTTVSVSVGSSTPVSTATSTATPTPSPTAVGDGQDGTDTATRTSGTASPTPTAPQTPTVEDRSTARSGASNTASAMERTTAEATGTSESTLIPTPTPTPTQPSPTPSSSPGQPGFGMIVALLAIITLTLLGRRRHD